MSLTAMQWCLARLYVSQTYRFQFSNDPDGALAGYGLSDDEAAAVRALDQHMLDVFAARVISSRERSMLRTFSSSFAWHHVEMDAALRRFVELNGSWPHPTFHYETLAFGRFAQQALSDPQRCAPGAVELVRFERASYEATFLRSADGEPSAQLQLSSDDRVRVRRGILIEDFDYDVIALDAALRAGTTNPDIEFQPTTIAFRPGRLQPQQRLLRLNFAMSSVLRHCAGGTTVADVVDDAIQDLGDEASRQDIIDALQELVALQIVTAAPGTCNERERP